jgi:hypothetical protein
VVHEKVSDLAELYCDMTNENWNSEVEARRPLLGKGSVIMFPLQRILTKTSFRYNKQQDMP